MYWPIPSECQLASVRVKSLASLATHVPVPRHVEWANSTCLAEVEPEAFWWAKVWDFNAWSANSFQHPWLQLEAAIYICIYIYVYIYVYIYTVHTTYAVCQVFSVAIRVDATGNILQQYDRARENHPLPTVLFFASCAFFLQLYTQCQFGFNGLLSCKSLLQERPGSAAGWYWSQDTGGFAFLWCFLPLRQRQDQSSRMERSNSINVKVERSSPKWWCQGSWTSPTTK